MKFVILGWLRFIIKVIPQKLPRVLKKKAIHAFPRINFPDSWPQHANQLENYFHFLLCCFEKEHWQLIHANAYYQAHTVIRKIKASTVSDFLDQTVQTNPDKLVDLQNRNYLIVKLKITTWIFFILFK